MTRYILEEYPFEIISRIFLFLSPKDVEHLCEDPILEGFAFERMYSCILLKDSGYVVSTDTMTIVPSKLLPELVFSEKWNAHKKMLRFTSGESLLALNQLSPDVLSKFETIEHVGFYDVYLDDVPNFQPFKNLVKIRCCSDRTANSRIELPPNLTHLSLWSLSFEQYPIGLVELNISADPINFASIPPTVKVMSIVESPISPQDIQHLTNLTTLSLQNYPRSVDLSSLKSLDHLICVLINWEKLKLPKNLITLDVNCTYVHSMQQLEELSRLRSLKLTNFRLSNVESLDIHYPATLQEIEYRDVLIKNSRLDVEDDRWGSNSEVPKVVNFVVPPLVKSLVLTKKDETNFYLHRQLLRTSTLRKIELDVDGIYCKDYPDRTQLTALDVCFPRDLEELQVRGITVPDPEQVEILRKLKKFVLNY